MSISELDSTHIIEIKPMARCLIGLYEKNAMSDLESVSSSSLENVKFLVASQSLNPFEPQIFYICKLENSSSEIEEEIVKKPFLHPVGEVYGLTTLAAYPDRFITSYYTYNSFSSNLKSGATIWKLPDLDLENDMNMKGGSTDWELQSITDLPLDDVQTIFNIVGHPNEDNTELTVLAGCNSSNSTASLPIGKSKNLIFLKCDDNGTYRESAKMCINTPRSYSNTSISSASGVTSMKRSPHRDGYLVGISLGEGVLGIDSRSLKESLWLKCPSQVRCLDFNPNRDHIVATGCDDGRVYLWDLRMSAIPFENINSVGNVSQKNELSSSNHDSFFLSYLYKGSENKQENQRSSPSTPLYQQRTHSHWVWSVQFHPTRDELLLSAGSDGKVAMHGLSSFSSESITCQSTGTDIENNFKRTPVNIPEGVIGHSNQHADSVYDCCWSPVDPWVYASLSYDGNLLISHVPDQVKLGILLGDGASMADSDEFSESMANKEQSKIITTYFEE